MTLQSRSCFWQYPVCWRVPGVTAHSLIHVEEPPNPQGQGEWQSNALSRWMMGVSRVWENFAEKDLCFMTACESFPLVKFPYMPCFALWWELWWWRALGDFHHRRSWSLMAWLLFQVTDFTFPPQPSFVSKLIVHKPNSHPFIFLLFFLTDNAVWPWSCPWSSSFNLWKFQSWSE